MKPWFLATLLMTLMAVPAAAAQTDEADRDAALRRCAQIEIDAERYRCYDRVLRPESAGASAPATAPEVVSGTTSGENPGAISGAAADALDAESAPAVAPSPSPSPNSAAPAPTVPAVAAPAGVEEAGPARPEEREQFGMENRRAERQEPPGRISVVIAAIAENPYGRLIFRTEDGQVWQQTDRGRRPPYASTPFAATIERGAMGSFFLKPDSGGYAVRVRRQK